MKLLMRIVFSAVPGVLLIGVLLAVVTAFGIKMSSEENVLLAMIFIGVFIFGWDVTTAHPERGET
jgi:hypothetical protein